MTKDYWELNDELESQKQAILAEAEEDERLTAIDNAERREAEAEFLAEAYADAEADLLETNPELFREVTWCCEVEPYDDRAFCPSCFKPNPEIGYERIEHLPLTSKN